MGARVAAKLRQVSVRGERVDAAAALEVLLVHDDPVRGREHLPLGQRADVGGRHLDVGVLERVLGGEAEADLLLERDIDRVAVARGSVGTLGRLDGSELARVIARRGACEGRRPPRGAAGARSVEVAIAGEAPGPVDEHPHADPLALGVVDVIDRAVPGRDELSAPDDRARVGVRGARSERRGDSLFAKLTHGAEPYFHAATGPRMKRERGRLWPRGRGVATGG